MILKEQIKFYENVFKWKIIRNGINIEYWLITTGQDNEPEINDELLPNEFSSMIRDNLTLIRTMILLEKIENSGGKMLSEKI